MFLFYIIYNTYNLAIINKFESSINNHLQILLVPSFQVGRRDAQ